MLLNPTHKIITGDLILLMFSRCNQKSQKERKTYILSFSISIEMLQDKFNIRNDNYYNSNKDISTPATLRSKI
jgi:hypothetical protein